MKIATSRAAPTARGGDLRPAEMAVRLQAPLMVPMGLGPLLCVADGHGDHAKAAALMHALAAREELPQARLVRIHNNEALSASRALFTGLDVDKGLISLGIEEGLPSRRDVELQRAFECIVDNLLPRAVIVFDGTDVALACAGVARGKGIPLVHIGAGLRVNEASFDGHAARVATDRLADLLYTTDAHASEALFDEGMPAERVHCAGNLLADAIQIAARVPRDVLPSHAGGGGPTSLLADRKGYALTVLGHPSNASDTQGLAELLSIVRDVSRDLPVVWPMPARLLGDLKGFAVDASAAGERIFCLPAQAYPDYLALLYNATCVLTDSWSVQEEATILGIPCLGIGACPERAITVSIGSNTVVSKSRTVITRAVWDCIFNGGKRGRVPDLWDGRAGGRIASYLSAWLPANAQGPSQPPVRAPSHVS